MARHKRIGIRPLVAVACGIGLTGTALAATASAGPGPAIVTQGQLAPFAAGAGGSVSGHAQMVRNAAGSTIVSLHVEGLAPGGTYCIARACGTVRSRRRRRSLQVRPGRRRDPAERDLARWRTSRSERRWYREWAGRGELHCRGERGVGRRSRPLTAVNRQQGCLRRPRVAAADSSLNDKEQSRCEPPI